MKKTFVFLSLMFLISCGPIYQTEYLFTPPLSTTGHACVTQCEISKSQCLQLEQLKAERCEYYSRDEVDRCEADIRWSEDRSPKWYECIPDSCDVDHELCDNNYRTCYLSCGGKVDPVTRCVANCGAAQAR
jgi:hypothetical protein